MSTLTPFTDNSTDGYEMILVPAGEAVFGSSADEPGAETDRQPQFRAHLPAYYLGKYPVTNRQYLQFVRETGHRPPEMSLFGKPVWEGCGFPEGLADHPVVCVTWDDAKTYCEWAALRLPTELEWEKGARGRDGRAFPWGNEWDPSKCRNALSATDVGTCAVSEYAQGCSPWGHSQMAGNVREWCADWLEERAYERYAAGDLTPPATGEDRVVKGGSWLFDSAQGLFRCACRGSTKPSLTDAHYGFRCARDAMPHAEEAIECNAGLAERRASPRGADDMQVAPSRAEEEVMTLEERPFVAAQAAVEFKEQALYPLPRGRFRQPVADPRGWHVAWIVLSLGPLGWGTRQSVWLDGELGPKYHALGGYPVFSQDGRRLAYVACREDKQSMVVDGQPGREYDRVAAPVFSPDGQRLAYAAHNRGRWFVVVDGEPGPEHDGIGEGSPIFSPDGQRVAYIAINGSKWLVVADGKPGPEYDSILAGGPIFSADGRRLGYAAQNGDRYLPVIDGQPGPEYRAVRKDHPVFSADGKRFAYAAESREGWLVVVDGQPEPQSRVQYDWLRDGNLVFDPDGGRLAYVAWWDKHHGQCVVVNGEPGPVHEFIDHGNGPIFSPDGQRMAYTARKGDKWLVVLDEQPCPEYDDISSGTLCFSPDGRRVAYCARRGPEETGRHIVVVDGEASTEYDAIGPLRFSPDGENLAYTAKKGRRWVAVLDGRTGLEYTLIVPNGPSFHEDGSLAFLAVRRVGFLGLSGPVLFRVTVSAKP